MKISASKYLRAADIAQPQLVTVERVDEEEMEDGSQKAVAYFTELAAGLVLNRVNSGVMVDTFGSDETDNWIGCAIVIFNDPTIEFQGRRVGGIRVRAPKTPIARKQVQRAQPARNSNGRSMQHNEHAAGGEDQDDLPF